MSDIVHPRHVKTKQSSLIGVLLGGAIAIFACACEQGTQTKRRDAAGAPPPKTLISKKSLPSHEQVEKPSAPTLETKTAANGADSREPAREVMDCPEAMKLVQGGQFWVGTKNAVFGGEENPRFQTRLPSFCADTFEVSTGDYEECQKRGECSKPELKNITCNSVEKGRADHPINCITHAQASAVCAYRKARLPTEIEWEYMARGGAEMRKYPWGDAPPDNHTCWKHGGSCKVGSYSVGAFGLHDVVGNVWEWTDSWFGRYPWPEKSGRHRVFRGGSWSRRFEKWMRPTLRNRVDPKKSGSHLGVRCVLNLAGQECPYGRSDEGICLAGVDAAQCLDGREWNGIRCAKSGDKERCPADSKEEKGYGCVSGGSRALGSQKLDLTGVTRVRSPEFDADCLTHTPGRPKAYRLEGGGHLARNVVGNGMGCKNRDVGVGFNSACCPQ